MKIDFKHLSFILLIVLLIGCKNNESRISKINSLIEQIDKEIKENKLKILQPDTFTYYSIPIKYYYNTDELRLIETFDGSIDGYCSNKYYFSESRLIYFYSDCGELKSDYIEKSDTIHFNSYSCKVTIERVYFLRNKNAIVLDSLSKIKELTFKRKTLITKDLEYLTDLFDKNN